jgi:predicted nucleic acid-binding protein
MDRLFLDANILFSAAYRADAGLLDLWKLKNVTLCTSPYALEEARINLSEDVQKERLTRLATVLEFNDAALQELPQGISLPEKDVPIMLAAIEARASHLITGDLRHFGPYFGKKISGVLIVSPGDYLKSRSQKPKTR